MATAFLAETAVEGMYFFPGLPNATEIGQEMDQLFAAFKTCTYKNRDKLYRARVSGDGADAIFFRRCWVHYLWWQGQTIKWHRDGIGASIH